MQCTFPHGDATERPKPYATPSQSLGVRSQRSRLAIRSLLGARFRRLSQTPPPTTLAAYSLRHWSGRPRDPLTDWSRCARRRRPTACFRGDDSSRGGDLGTWFAPGSTRAECRRERRRRRRVSPSSAATGSAGRPLVAALERAAHVRALSRGSATHAVDLPRRRARLPLAVCTVVIDAATPDRRRPRRAPHRRGGRVLLARGSSGSLTLFL